MIRAELPTPEVLQGMPTMVDEAELTSTAKNLGIIAWNKDNPDIHLCEFFNREDGLFRYERVCKPGCGHVTVHYYFWCRNHFECVVGFTDTNPRRVDIRWDESHYEFSIQVNAVEDEDGNTTVVISCDDDLPVLPEVPTPITLRDTDALSSQEPVVCVDARDGTAEVTYRLLRYSPGAVLSAYERCRDDWSRIKQAMANFAGGAA